MKRTPRSRNSFADETSGDWHHYLPVPDPLVLSSFYVTSVGQSTIRPGEAYPRYQHPQLYHFSWENGRALPEFQILLLTAGRGRFQSRETGEMTIVAGQAMLLCPNVWHRYRPHADSGWTEKWLQFDGTFAAQLMDQGILSASKPIINPPDFRAADDHFNRLLEIIHQAPTVNTLLFSLEALTVITSVVRESPALPLRFQAANSQHPDAIVAMALDYIWTQGGNVIGVPAVASAVGVTRRTLERHMFTTLGHGVLEEIINCRFARAERLLRSTTFSLKTIVYLAGFGSIENMRQVFTSRTKMSPSIYRSKTKMRNEPAESRRTST